MYLPCVSIGTAPTTDLGSRPPTGGCSCFSSRSPTRRTGSAPTSQRRTRRAEHLAPQWRKEVNTAPTTDLGSRPPTGGCSCFSSRSPTRRTGSDPTPQRRTRRTHAPLPARRATSRQKCRVDAADPSAAAQRQSWAPARLRAAVPASQVGTLWAVQEVSKNHAEPLVHRLSGS